MWSWLQLCTYVVTQHWGCAVWLQQCVSVWRPAEICGPNWEQSLGEQSQIQGGSSSAWCPRWTLEHHSAFWVWLTNDYDPKDTNPHGGRVASVCGVCMFSSWMHGVSSGTPASSNRPKTCFIGWLFTLIVSRCDWAPAADWWPVQGITCLLLSVTTLGSSIPATPKGTKRPRKWMNEYCKSVLSGFLVMIMPFCAKMKKRT